MTYDIDDVIQIIGYCVLIAGIAAVFRPLTLFVPQLIKSIVRRVRKW